MTTPLPGSPDTIPAGALLMGRYRVIRQLGQGGMGVVYQVQDEDPLHRGQKVYYALKLLLSQDQGSRRRFLREAKIAQEAPRHPNLIHAVAGEDVQGAPYLLMPFLRGRPLDEWITPQQPLELRRALELFVGALEGLEALHKVAIHKDIKPSNLFVEALEDEEERLVILDLGVAREHEGSQSSTPISTMQYIAPEYLIKAPDPLPQNIDPSAWACV